VRLRAGRFAPSHWFVRSPLEDMMKRSLVAGAVAVGMLFAAFVGPATAAAAAEILPSPGVDCGITVWSEAEAPAPAEACDPDVKVPGTS